MFLLREDGLELKNSRVSFRGFTIGLGVLQQLQCFTLNTSGSMILAL